MSVDDSFLPPHWDTIGPQLDRLLEADPANRGQLLAEITGEDTERRRALEQLLAECERAMPLLDGVASERLAALARDGDSLGYEPPAMLGGRYRIGDEVGQGGMARVFRAEDIRHGRSVAVKVIRPELSASLGRGRFLREIGMVARLRHPNIMPLFDSGEDDGVLYYVMPLETGASLKARLARGEPIPLAECLSILRDVARAIAHAHGDGIVHRDIKPANVMLSGGAAVVADFGIGKAFTAARDAGDDPHMTSEGAIVGTPAYMAPEQAVGDPSTDHRADIYSYGCLAYELFAGHPPFHGKATHELIADHVGTVPRPLVEVRADVPEAVAQLVGRCLEKSPDARPQSAADLLGGLEGAVTTSRVRRPYSPRAAAVAVLTVAVIGIGIWSSRQQESSAAAPITVSVLPFVNIANDTALEAFADGLSEEVATPLGRVPGIQIQSRHGARLYRGQLGVDVTEAGSRLNADYVVTGAMRASAGEWIITVELTSSTSGGELWSGRFRSAPEQQLGVAGEIASTIAAQLRARFPGLGAAPNLADNQMTKNPEAFRYYVLGQGKLSRRGLSVRESAKFFGQAIREDSLFARAYSGLSMSLVLFPHFQGIPARDVNDSVVYAARRALQLDPRLAQPHVALGTAHQFAYRWDSAAAEYEMAIQLDDRDVEARVQYARHLLFRGRHAEAMKHLRAVRAEDQASALLLSWLGYAYYLDGQLDSAMAESRRALENDSTNFTSLVFGALIRLEANRGNEARALVDRLPASNEVPGYVVARSGDSVGARRQLATLAAQRPRPWQAHTRMAYYLLGLRDTASALRELELATESGEMWPILQAASDPLFDSIRGSGRFAMLLQKVGLPGSAGVRRRRG